MNIEGYEQLAAVLQDAYDQAAKGKGAARHGTGKPFHEQPMQDLIRLYGPGFALGQAAKKMQESQRMDRDAAERELLGAIVYIAGAIIAARGGVADGKAEAVQTPVVQTLCDIPVGQWITRGDPLFENGKLLPRSTPLLVRLFGDVQPTPTTAGMTAPLEWNHMTRGLVTAFKIVGVPLECEPKQPVQPPSPSRGRSSDLGPCA